MSVIRLLHRVYKVTLSPLLAWVGGPGSGCRFEPSCSDYALEAIETHGPGAGAWMALKRLARCQPWGSQGCDPVPPVARMLGARRLCTPLAAKEKPASAHGAECPPRPLEVPVSR